MDSINDNVKCRTVQSIDLNVNQSYTLSKICILQNTNTEKGKPIFSSSKPPTALGVEMFFYFHQTTQTQSNGVQHMNDSFASLWFSHTEADSVTIHVPDILPVFFMLSCNKSLTNSNESSSVFTKDGLVIMVPSWYSYYRNETWLKTWLSCTSPEDLPH